MESGLSAVDLKVFNAIKAIMIEDDFQEANTMFFMDNCRVFDENEENKLEYTELYHTYLKIVEDVLEA